MEIRIPNKDATKFDQLIAEMNDENIRVSISKIHKRRDGSLSIQATLRPALPIETSRRYRPVGRGYSRNGRVFSKAINAICFHGHFAFMKRLFTLIPEAKLQSAMTRRFSEKWMTTENFSKIAQEIAEVNVGSFMEPIAYADRCNCGVVELKS